MSSDFGVKLLNVSHAHGLALQQQPTFNTFSLLSLLISLSYCYNCPSSIHQCTSLATQLLLSLNLLSRIGVSNTCCRQCVLAYGALILLVIFSVEHVHMYLGSSQATPVATHSDVTHTTNTTTEATITYSPATPETEENPAIDENDDDEEDDEDDAQPNGGTSHTSRTSSPPSERHSTAEAAYEDMLADFGEAQAPRAEMEDAEFDLSPMSQISQLQMMVDMHTAQLDEEQDKIDEERDRLIAQQLQGGRGPEQAEASQPKSAADIKTEREIQREMAPPAHPEIESDLEGEIEPESDSEPEPEPEPARAMAEPVRPSQIPTEPDDYDDEEEVKRSTTSAAIIGSRITSTYGCSDPSPPAPRTLKPVCGI